MKTLEERELELENLIDRTPNPDYFFNMLANIYREKAEHIRSNWQDEELAASYDEIADQLNAIKI